MRTYTTTYKFTLKYCNNLISKQMTDYWWTISPPGYHPPSSQKGQQNPYTEEEQTTQWPRNQVYYTVY
jgi:hypothetical protein